jgi:hypothetical protein
MHRIDGYTQILSRQYVHWNHKSLLGADYMESFQPGLSFSPVKRAEIASQLQHEQFEPGLSLVRAIFIVNWGWNNLSVTK